MAVFCPSIANVDRAKNCINTKEYTAGKNKITSSAGVAVVPWETFQDPRSFDYIEVVGGLLSE